MKNATGNDRHTAEQDDRTRPDAGPDAENIRGVADDVDEFEEGDDEDDAEGDEDEGSF